MNSIPLQLTGYQCSSAIHVAVETGFRHFDTAFNYENERQVGEAIRTQIQMGNVSRENIFLTTKVRNHIRPSFPSLSISFSHFLTLGSFGTLITIPAMCVAFVNSNWTSSDSIISTYISCTFPWVTSICAMRLFTQKKMTRFRPRTYLPTLFI